MPAVESAACNGQRQGCSDTFSLFQASGQPPLSRMRSGYSWILPGACPEVPVATMSHPHGLGEGWAEP